MRHFARMCFAVVLAVASVSCAFGMEEDKSSSSSDVYHEDTITKTVVIPMIYGESDDNLILAFEENDADLVVIKEGDGGEMIGMYKTLDYLRTHPDKHVVIDGACYSACTFLLDKKLKEGQVCFTKEAKFGFHSTHGEWPKGMKVTPAMKRESELLTKKLNDQQINLFDEPLKIWLIENDAFSSTEITAIKVREMQQLTHKGCGSGNPLAHLEH